MQDVRIICPGCTRRLKLGEPVAPGHRLRCPECGLTFNVQSHDIVPANGRPSAPEDLKPAPATLPVATVQAAPLPSATFAPPTPVPAEGNGRVMLFVAGGAILLLGLGIGLVVALSGGKDDTPIVQDEKKPDDKQPDDKQPDEKKPPDQLPSDEKRPPNPPPNPPPPPLTSLPPEQQAKVNEAIDRGVQFLKSKQLPDGNWSEAGFILGSTALPGLTLLECGVPANDPAVQKVAAYVREHAPGNLHTYEVSLCILFLDRLGDPKDRRLIQSLGLRLLVGQLATGGWGYTLEALEAPHEEELYFALVESRPDNPLELFKGDEGDDRMKYIVARAARAKQARSGGPGDGTGRPPDSPAPGDKPMRLDRKDKATPLDQLPHRKPDLSKLPGLAGRPVLKPLPAARDLPQSDTSDNSNTQFGILGVWAAGRHGVPTEKSLALIVKRFHRSQSEHGTWGYYHSSHGVAVGTMSMTCAGLLGLAVGHGLVYTPGVKSTEKDPAIEKGLKALAGSVGNPTTKRAPNEPAPPATDQHGIYFLWSLERVAVLYNLPTIAGKDWYGWGVEHLLGEQNKDGSWPVRMEAYADTCMALLFLKRTNLVQDLSKRVEFFVEDIKPERK